MQAEPGHKRGVFSARAALHKPLCREHYLLTVELERFPPTRAGQFVQLQCRGIDEPAGARQVDWPDDRPPRLGQRELAADEPLLRRPFSLAARRDLPGRVELDIIYRVVGRGTAWLSRLEPGDPLSVLGPLGNSFRIHHDKPYAALVGGGVGIPPMIYLARALKDAGRESFVFVGAQSADLLPLALVEGARAGAGGEPARLLEAFAPYGTGDVIATDDGSVGRKGFVTEALADWLAEVPFPPDQLAVYCCGPEAMMKATAELCRKAGIACQVSMERSMACGMGTCQSCICKTRADNDQGFRYSLCCTDGPVFEAQEILW